MRAAMLIVSVVLGVLPLLGVGYIALSDWALSVDGLFLMLILLTVGGVFLLNAAWEAKSLGLIPKRKKAAADAGSKAAHGA